MGNVKPARAQGGNNGAEKSKNESKHTQKKQVSGSLDAASRDQNIGHQQQHVEGARSNHGHSSGQLKKLRRLPENARIQKRPILRPPIASPYAGKQSQKVVYVSSKMPFISAVKRTRKLLNQIDKRSMGKVDLLGKGKDREKIAQTGTMEKGEPEEVVLKATGKAIEKAMSLALFFQGQEDCKVRIRTGSVAVVDDIVEVSEPRRGDAESMGQGVAAGKKRKRRNDDVDGYVTEALQSDQQANGKVEATSTDKEVEDIDDELPETQMRRTSMIEIAVTQSIQ